METLFTNSHIKVSDAHKILPNTFVVHWAGFWTHENAVCMEALEQITALIKKYQAKFLLSDYSRFEIYTVNMLNHLLEVWYPQLVTHGLTMELYIMPQDMVSEANLEDKFEQLEQNHLPLITPKVESHDHAYNLIREYHKLYGKYPAITPKL